MMMWKHDQFLDFAVLLALLLLAATGWAFLPASGTEGGGPSFGINYGKVANNLPAPADVVTLIQSISITKSKLYDADPAVLSTFGNTGISFIVGTANEDLPQLTNPALAMAWVSDNIARHLPSTHITGIVVGNEIFSGTDPTLMSQVLPAMENVYAALQSLDLHHQIVVSTAHSFATLATSYPPSAGSFNPSIANLYMKPVLNFLSQTGSPFLINVYPFFAYKDNPSTVSLDYVLFQTNPGVLDDSTKLRYYNMFDAQMDAVYSAIESLGFNNITLLVSETGWPSAGDVDEPGATVANAQIYHQNLVRHVTSNKGTPLKPNVALEVYLFALFNEDMKPGPTSERNYGLFRPDGTRVYNFQFYHPSWATSSSCPLKLASFTLVYLYYIVMYILTNSNAFS
eukprot:c1517_g1_i1 orf=83-1279(+)